MSDSTETGSTGTTSSTDTPTPEPSGAEQAAAAQQVQMVLFLAAWKRLAAGVVLLAVLPATAFAVAMDLSRDHTLTGMLSWAVAVPVAVSLSLLVREASVEEIAEQFIRQGALAEQRGGSFADRFAEAQRQTQRQAEGGQIGVPASSWDPDGCDLCETDEALQGRSGRGAGPSAA